MIRVTLVDGRVLGGYYGPGSLASYSEHDQDLLISQRWVLDEDGWFLEPAPGSLGLWIPRENIPSIELSEAADAGADDTDATWPRIRWRLIVRTFARRRE